MKMGRRFLFIFEQFFYICEKSTPYIFTAKNGWEDRKMLLNISKRQKIAFCMFKNIENVKLLQNISEISIFVSH